MINWINSLKNAGYITVEHVRAPGPERTAVRRAIRIRDGGAMKFFSRSGENGGAGFADAPGEKDIQNATGTSQKARIFSSFAKKFPPRGEKTGLAAVNWINSLMNFFSPPMKKSSPGGENSFTQTQKDEKSFPEKGEDFFTHNSTSVNKATTTGPSSGSGPEAAAAGFTDTPEEEEKETAAESVQKLKDALAAIDRGLLLKNSFYPRAAAFMAASGLDGSYLSWLYALCLSKKPRSLDGLFFTLFFEDNIIGIFRARSTPPPPAMALCPVCGTSHEKNLECPVCGTGRFASQTDIENLKQVYSLPPAARESYLAEQEEILLSGGLGGDFKAKSARLNALREKYGLAWNGGGP